MLRETANIIEDQLNNPGQLAMWMKSIIDENVGHDLVDFVTDIRRVEGTSRRRDTTWAKNKGKRAHKRVKYTMGYQPRSPSAPSTSGATFNEDLSSPN